MLASEKSFSRVSIIGLGYIGLPTAAILASRKISVIGVDVRDETIEIINQGKIHFIEPELDIVVHAVVAEGYLQATKNTTPSDAFLIAVPTPINDNNEPDLSYVKSASNSIASVLKKGDLVILESTSPVGTTEQLSEWLAKARPDLTFPQTHGETSDIRIAYCPERVLPGHVLHELIINDRIIGGMTSACSKKAIELYKIFVEGECIETNVRTAELCKLTENSFRDINIAFANELSMICDRLNIDVRQLIRLANRHPRVNILNPGPGVGGHCIAVDPWFIVSSAPEEAQLIRNAREVNDKKPLWVINKVKECISAILLKNPEKTEKDITIACFGLTFKADIDDLRESPALEIVMALSQIHSGDVVVVEPNIKHLPAALLNKTELFSVEKACAEADLIVMLVNHKAFELQASDIYIHDNVVDICGAMQSKTYK